jgi:hypothetical protein
MSDPHAPTPAGPDPDEETAVHPTVAADAFAPPVTEPASVTEPAPAVEPAAAVEPAVTGPAAVTDAPEGDWLKPDADTTPATPAPEPVIPTPSSFTPPGTPEHAQPSPLDQAQAQAAALAEKPEAMVGLAFVGGVVASFVLKRFGR